MSTVLDYGFICFTDILFYVAVCKTYIYICSSYWIVASSAALIYCCCCFFCSSLQEVPMILWHSTCCLITGTLTLKQRLQHCLHAPLIKCLDGVWYEDAAKVKAPNDQHALPLQVSHSHCFLETEQDHGPLCAVILLRETFGLMICSQSLSS